jgi:uncharacterized membrane protein YphA (DoxX/SURF4 family)
VIHILDVLLFVARMAIALVFAIAGFSKLTNRAGTEKAVVDFSISLPIAKPIALVVTLNQHAAHKDKRGHDLWFHQLIKTAIS